MQPDPTLDHVREVRHRISEQCAHDPKKLVEYYIQLQAQYTDRLLEPGKDKQPQATPTPAEPWPAGAANSLRSAPAIGGA